jgi:hypothetical protein
MHRKNTTQYSEDSNAVFVILYRVYVARQKVVNATCTWARPRAWGKACQANQGPKDRVDELRFAGGKLEVGVRNGVGQVEESDEV